MSLIERLEKQIEEEKDGIEKYTELFKHVPREGKIVKILNDIIDDEHEHIELLEEAIEILEEEGEE